MRFAALFCVMLGAAACHGAVSEEPAACASDACDAGGLPSASDASRACPSPSAPDGGFAPYQSFASGNVSGASTNAVLCNAGVALTSYDYGGQPGSGSMVFELDTNVAFASLNVGAPSGAVSGTFTASIAVAAAAPGVYTSADPQACGALTFSYGTLTPGTDCHFDAGSYTCPSGCTLTYFCGEDASDEPCCVPLAETFQYQATGCTAKPQAQPTLGGWTLTLTSVTRYDGDAGQDYGVTRYLAHGTLTATLKGTVDTTDGASVAVSF